MKTSFLSVVLNKLRSKTHYIMIKYTITQVLSVPLPCGLKNPVIQNTFGLPSYIQVENWVFLSKSSVNQNPSVEESQDTLFHI